ncbi:armadillo-type protein [Coemansia spiralis]|nr:armadillo-type protein [Coemansia spiralis]
MADEEDFSSLPLDQRLTHKVWKVRLGAYNDLASELKTLDPDTQAAQFNNYENYLSKMILDSNMATQEVGISTVIAFVANAPNPTRRREEIVAGIVSKCLAASKAGTRTQSVELLLLLSEVDTPGPVVTEVIEGFDAKQPKAIAAAVAAVREIVHAYGVKFINIKALLKALGKPFAHKDSAVRKEAQDLTIELFRWMGHAIMPFLQDLSPVLLKELESKFAPVANGAPPKQARLLRSQQEVDEPTAPTSDNAGADTDVGENIEQHEEQSAGIDAWELADPVDIMSKLPDDFFQFIGSTKWKERKQVVEELHETLKKSIRLQFTSGTGDIIQELGKKIGDTNIIVATHAIQCLGLFAARLRQPFAPYVQSTLPALVEKSKERKQTVIDAIRETTDAYFTAINYDLTAIGDHYFTGATHKNPQVRAESDHFLRRCFASVPTRPGKGDIKRYADQLKAGFEDGDAGVREAAAECLGTLSKLVTHTVLEPFIDGLDKIKLEKVNEYSEKAKVKARAAPKSKTQSSAASTARTRPQSRAPAGAASRAPPSSQPRAIAAVAEQSQDDGASQSVSANLPPHIRKKLEASARAAALKKAQREGRPLDELDMGTAPLPPSAPTAAARPKVAPPPKRPAAAPPVEPAAGNHPSAKGKAAGVKDLGEAIKMRYANEDNLDEVIANAIPENILSGFESVKWKERMEAIDQLKEYMGDQTASGSTIHPELIIRQLARKPGWKESNFQVNARAFQLIEWMASEQACEFNTGAAALCIPALVDKLGDIKLKAPASGALVTIAERYSLKFVVGLTLSPIKSQKSPKVVADCISWLETQLLEFGIKGLALRAIVDVVKEVGLQSNNAQTRTKGVSCMGTLRRAVGPSVIDLIDDLNPQLLQLVEAEFEKVGDQPMPDPIRTQRSLSNDAGGNAGGSHGDASSGATADDDAMDDLFPRQDLNAAVGPSIYKKLGDSNWKERKAALDAILYALESAKHRIQPNISSDLYVALKQRLQDANKNLVAVALGILGTLSTDSNSASVPNIRLVALSTIQCLADKKVQVRTAAIAAMTAWAEASSICVDQAVLPAIPNALSDTSPELRSSLLQWIADTLGLRSSSNKGLPDMSPLIGHLFTCLQDRNVEVRKQANRVLALTVASCGFETVHDACSMQLHGAAKNTVMPMIEEFRHTIGAASAASSAPTAASRLRPGGAASHRSLGANERTASPTPEPVMTASELLGRTPVNNSRTAPSVSTATSNNAAATAAASGPGMLRRPMAVRRPAGSAGGVTTGLSSMRQARPVRGPPGSTEASRPGSSMRGSTPAPQSIINQLARMSNEELENIPPVLDQDIRAKEQRARRDMVANPHGAPKWSLLGDQHLRTELELQLKDQMAAHFNPLVHRMLFSAGHYKDRDYLSGLTAIEEVIGITSLSQQRFGLPLHADSPDDDSLANRFIANIDLLLKYISIRMYEGSTHTLLKSFDLLEHLVRMVEENQQQQHHQQPSPSWSDYEVQAVLPALVSRLGDAKEVVRARSRRLLTQLIIHLYPTTKLFVMLLEHGVQNKINSRIRQEALDSICFLIRERTAGLGLGAVCSHPDRAIPIVVKCIADRDSNVRAAALNVMVAIGEQLPGGADELWHYSGRIDQKERVMLEEKLKRSSIGAGTGSQFGSDNGVQRPGSRIGMGHQAGARTRMSQHSASGAAGLSAGLRAGTGISRPVSTAGAGGLPRGIGGTGASRLARPPSSLVPPSSQPGVYSGELESKQEYGGFQQQQSLSHYGGGSGGTNTGASGRPMFSLDFDNLNLPRYSSATADQLGSGRGTGLRVGAAADPPELNRSPNSEHSDGPSTAVGFGAGRNESLRNALSAMNSGRNTAITTGMGSGGNGGSGLRTERPFISSPRASASPVIDAAVGNRSVSMIYGSPRSPSDFSSMSEPERIQWIDSLVTDLGSENFGTGEKALDRIRGLLSTTENESDDEIQIQHYSPALTHICRNITRILNAIVVQMRWVFTINTTDPSTGIALQSSVARMRRATLDLLIDIFSYRKIAGSASLSALQPLLEDLIKRLVDPALKSDSRSQERSGGAYIEDAQLVSKTLNVVIVKILDMADTTSVFIALVRLLEFSMAEPAPNPPETDSDITRMEFGEMTMKCLWRITKPLESVLQMQFMDAISTDAAVIPDDVAYPQSNSPNAHQIIRVDRLLYISHVFFKHIPDSEWRRREDKTMWMFGDLPKRTVKTINHSIASALGGLVWQFTGLIIRDVMETHPGLLSQPPPAAFSSEGSSVNADDRSLNSWLMDTHLQLMRVSGVWTYLNTTLSLNRDDSATPNSAQLLAAFHAAQVPEPDDHQIADGIVTEAAAHVSFDAHLLGGLHLQPQSPSRSGSAMSISSSPYQQPRFVQPTTSAERSESPALASNRQAHIYSSPSRAVSPPYTGSEHSRNMPSPSQQQASTFGLGATRATGTSYISASNGASNTTHVGAADSNSLFEYAANNICTSSISIYTTITSGSTIEPVPNMEDIRQKIAHMRNSLRSQKK